MTSQEEGSTILQRLSRIEGALSHMATAERLARVEAQVASIHEQMPMVTRNALSEAKHDGWKAAKEDAENDHRGTIAIFVSLGALLSSIWVNFWGN